MTRQQSVLQVLSDHPDWGRSKISAHLGISQDAARHAIDALKIKGSKPDAPQKENEITLDLGRDSGTATSLSRNIKTVDDLIRFAEVDLKIWEVERYVVNKWEVGAKDEDKNVRVTPLFQVKAWLRKKVFGAKDSLSGILGEFTSKSPRLIPVRYHSKSGNALEISVCDPHHGKLAWGQETGAPYDLKISTRVQEQAIEYLLDISSPFKPEKILMVCGNDYFHTDNTTSTTTAGTPQDCDSRWQKQFTTGIRSMVKGIELARKVAAVHVSVIPGNHDTQMAFCLGEVLAAWFRNVPGVQVDNGPMVRKYWQWGKCLLGLTHGNNEKVASLPLIMATEVPQQWASSKFREIHVGHHHRKMEYFFKSADESNGVRYRALPSLTPADAWHKMHGYAAIRAAEAFVLNTDQGFIGNFSFSPN